MRKWNGKSIRPMIKCRYEFMDIHNIPRAVLETDDVSPCPLSLCLNVLWPCVPVSFVHVSPCPKYSEEKSSSVWETDDVSPCLLPLCPRVLCPCVPVSTIFRGEKQQRLRDGWWPLSVPDALLANREASDPGIFLCTVHSVLYKGRIYVHNIHCRCIFHAFVIHV